MTRWRKPLILFLILLNFFFCFGSNSKNPKILDTEVQSVIRRATYDQPEKPSSDQKKARYISNINGMQSKGLSRIKLQLEHRVNQAQLKVNNTKGLSDKEKDFKLHVLEMFLEELRESERDMIDSEQALKKSLAMDFWNSSTLMVNSKRRLDALRIATLKEEKSYNRMVQFEKMMENYLLSSNSTSWVDEILKDVAHAADQLQDQVGDHVVPEHPMNVRGADIEAVMHMKSHLQYDDEQKPPDEDVDILIDSRNNKYILTRQEDAMSPYIDHLLVMNIIWIVMTCLPLGSLCQILGVPSLFGYILAGLVLGPSGLNVIQEMVQMETIGELGVFMIMFCAGLEFSFVHIQKVWKVAVQTPLFTTVIMVVAGIIISSVFMKGIPLGESAFVSSCFSFSSTPLVSRFLQGAGKESITSDYSTILLGVLVMQDVQLSVLVAAIPNLALHKTGDSPAFLTTLHVFLWTLFSLSLVVAVCGLVYKFIMPYYAMWVLKQRRELQLLGVLCVMFVCQLLTRSLGTSMELGCFIAGVVVAHAFHEPAIKQKVQVIHDFFSIIFFATMGFHVFPSFVLVEFTLLISLTVIVVAGKFLISLLVLRFILPPQSQNMKWLISSGLAQVSEFSFVIGSRACHLKIISREVFLLILSITTISLVFAPVLWKLSLWRYRLNQSLGHLS
ncbi:transmembrane and coiled-coil domain-containing protein 3 isoform X1 [Ciona intestinalis]